MKSCDDFLKEVEERAARATLDWETLDSEVQHEGLTHRKDILSGPVDAVSRYTVASGVCENDAEFIAASRSDVEVLCKGWRAAILALKDAQFLFCTIRSNTKCIGLSLCHVDGNCVHCLASTSEYRIRGELVELDRIAGEVGKC